MKVDNGRIRIRLGQIQDVPRISVLCGQLGYPSSLEEVQNRFEQIRQDQRHAVYVAEFSSGSVVGWVEVQICQTILTENDLRAEVAGLVVDEACRRSGAGKLLMLQAEEWARERGCWMLYLRSNVIRRDAHKFYESIGYSMVKTQLALRKILQPGMRSC